MVETRASELNCKSFNPIGWRRAWRGAMASLTAAMIAAALLGTGARARAGDGKGMGEGDEPEAVLPVVASTIPSPPAPQDVNPYGVEFVPSGFPKGGLLRPGDLLVSNFNDSDNFQGTGRTIVKFSPDGQQSLFFQGNPGLGLTTALEVLKKGFVLVGNFPAPASGPNAGSCNASSPGSILIIDSSGNQVGSIEAADLNGLLNGPWDSTIDDNGSKVTLFVSSALTGSVLRFELTVGGSGVSISSGPTVVADGYTFGCDPLTFVQAPTGLVFDKKHDRLFVASTDDNAVFAVENASQRTSSGGTGVAVFTDAVHLHGALAMVQGPFGHLFVSNNDNVNLPVTVPSAITEFSVDGCKTVQPNCAKFIRQFSIDPAPGGAFGLNFDQRGDDTRFAFVDDNVPNVTIWNIAGEGHKH
jgi:hypothetical protein